MKVVSVKFKENGRAYYFDPGEFKIKMSGLKRNGVFAGAAAEQNGQLSSGHNHTSLFCLSKA